MPVHKSGKKNRKHRRNKEWCQKYEQSGRRETNKAINIARHRAEHPADTAQKRPPNYTRKKPLDVYEKLFSKNTWQILERVL